MSTIVGNVPERVESKLLKPAYATVLITALMFLVYRTEAQMYDTNYAYVVETFAGSGFAGYLDGQGTQSMFAGPSGLVADSSSNLFVLDSGNSRIRKISPTRVVSTFVGGGTNTLPGSGSNVLLPYMPYTKIAMDVSNTIWVANIWAGMPAFLLRIDSDGQVSSNFIASLSTAYGTGSGSSWTNGSKLQGVSVDSRNRLYLTGQIGTSNCVLRYNPTDGASEVFASFTNYSPSILTADEADNIYTLGTGTLGLSVCRIQQNGNVSTICGGNPNLYGNVDGVGTNASFGMVEDMRSDGAGNLILACIGSLRKLNVATSNVTTIAGSFTTTGFVNGTGYLARFGWADGVCLSHGQIFLTDHNNQCIREIYLNPETSNVLTASISAVVSITGVVGRRYQIESTTNLTDWSTAQVIVLTSSPYLWIDQSPVSGNRSYRAVLLP